MKRGEQKDLLLLGKRNLQVQGRYNLLYQLQVSLYSKSRSRQVNIITAGWSWWSGWGGGDSIFTGRASCSTRCNISILCTLYSIAKVLQLFCCSYVSFAVWYCSKNWIFFFSFSLIFEVLIHQHSRKLLWILLVLPQEKKIWATAATELLSSCYSPF